jgi:hypothetical protein
MALVLVPSWLLLVWRARHPGRGLRALWRPALVSCAPLLLFLPVYGWLVGWLGAGTGGDAGARLAGAGRTVVTALVSLAGPGEPMGEHVVSLANGALLVGPWSLMLGVLALSAGRTGGAAGTSRVHFAAALVFPATMLALVIGDSNLGYARNWDVLTPASVLIATSGCLLMPGHLTGAWLRRVATMLIASSLLHTLPWLAVNSSEPATLARFARLPLGPGRAASTLGLWHALHGRNDEAEAAWERGLREDPGNERLLLFLGRMATERRHYDRAESLYARARARRPDFPAALAGEALALVLEGRRDSALAVVRREASVGSGTAAAREVLAVFGAVDGRASPLTDSLLIAGLAKLASESR